jgi:hypothetical protein
LKKQTKIELFSFGTQLSFSISHYAHEINSQSLKEKIKRRGQL